MPATATTVPVTQLRPTVKSVGADFATYHWTPSVSPASSTSANVKGFSMWSGFGLTSSSSFGVVNAIASPSKLRMPSLMPGVV